MQTLSDTCLNRIRRSTPCPSCTTVSPTMMTNNNSTENNTVACPSDLTRNLIVLVLFMVNIIIVSNIFFSMFLIAKNNHLLHLPFVYNATVLYNLLAISEYFQDVYPEINLLRLRGEHGSFGKKRKSIIIAQ